MMIPDIERTIVALASGARPAQRAIVRLSGPATRDTLAQLLDLTSQAHVLSSKRLAMTRAKCFLPQLARHIDVRVLYWPDAHSYTGQPAAELHLLGCLPLAEAIIERCCQLGARPAERGEFTLRAFLAGKLDLAQAEAVLGVIEADSAENLKAALTQLGGNLAPAVKPLRDTIVDIVAELEAGLDFVDEDIEFITRDSVKLRLLDVRAALLQFAARLRTRSSADVAPRAVLVGLPNSGKSSLFNALCQSGLAIVADIPGTTRDYLQHRVRVEDTEVELIDTAGWEDLQGDSPRAMAQQQLLSCLETAELCLLCVDSAAPLDVTGLTTALSRADTKRRRWLLIGTKTDLPNANPEAVSALATHLSQRIELCAAALGTSSRTGHGLGNLRRAIAAVVTRSTSVEPLAVVHHTAVRCRAAVAAAVCGIEEALLVAEYDHGEELIAAELRLVLDELATIIGEVHSDDILGEIFSRFCIGK